jgi:anaerobic selenocysteine-containing dehydrogenase
MDPTEPSLTDRPPSPSPRSGTTTHKTICNRDCPDACRIVATVRGGRVVKLGGDPEHPVTRGFLCWRTNHFLEMQYGPDRVTQPMRRGIDGLHHPISWNAALDEIAERFLAFRRESGPASIFHYRSGGSLGLLMPLVDWFFECFGPVTIKRGDICSGAGEAAQEADFGECESHDLFDLLHSKHILLWGKNVHVSSPHTIPVLRDARARGAEIVLIDPVRHKGADFCDVYWQPRPGGDCSLAMATARLLFERGAVSPRATAMCDHIDEFRDLAFTQSMSTWCEQADVPRAAAEDLASRLGAGPTAILVGWGMARRANGGAIVRALDALSALSGNLGISGGGASYYYRRRRAVDVSFVKGKAAAPRTICEPLWGREVLDARDPPVRAVWITAGNPVVMLPDAHLVRQALSSREFVVVVDPFYTDTARLADIVLPTTTLLESDDLVGAYGHHHVGVARPTIARPEGVLDDLEIVQALAARVGLTAELAGTAREWQERIIAPAARAAGLTLQTLEAAPTRNPLAPRVLFADGKVPTPTGRVNLMTAVPRAPQVSAAYPLLLLSLSSDRSQSSQWSRAIDGPAGGPPVCTVHPATAADAGIADGEVARLESEIGAIDVRVRTDADQRTDVAIVPKGGHLSTGHSANALIRAALTDMGEGGALYDEPVRLVASQGSRG